MSKEDDKDKLYRLIDEFSEKLKTYVDEEGFEDWDDERFLRSFAEDLKIKSSLAYRKSVRLKEHNRMIENDFTEISLKCIMLNHLLKENN